MAPVAIAPVLNGSTLPHPTEYSEELFYRGGTRRMANGSLVRDLISTSIKTRFHLTWAALTQTERSTVVNAFHPMADGTSASFTSPRNGSATVVIAEDGVPEWEVIAVKNKTELRLAGTLVLEEV